MRKIREVILVEGRYDKNALSQVVDATILETKGFGIFHDRQMQRLLRTMAESRGLIVLTDSDGAGFHIRDRIRGYVPAGQVKHAYIPDVYGKERRKRAPSKEGKLGVEGMSPAVLLDALRRAGATFEDEEKDGSVRPQIAKADLYALGLSGGLGSKELRAGLLRELDLPERLTANALLDVLNALMDRDALRALLLRIAPVTAENADKTAGDT